MASGYQCIRPILYLLPPETAHQAALVALKSGWIRSVDTTRYPSLQTRCFGLTFPNPVGLAAGFDKNAVAIDALLGQGFGFVEAGTVTPQAQSGNPKPRLFRLLEDEAVINRLGFNNDGLAAYIRNFSARDTSLGIAGANIGKNKDSTDAIADYETGLAAVYPYADYVTVNISSPNTAGLRDLQKGSALEGLLAALVKTRESCVKQHGKCLPLLLKIAPDLDEVEISTAVSLSMSYGVDGLVVGNTTLSRPEGLRSKGAKEQGGLSGRPLFTRSTEILKICYRQTQGKLPLIGVGGITSAADAYTKIRAGASLVQLYTALVYQGFGLVQDIQEGLVNLLVRDGYAHISQAVGVDCR